MKLCSQCEFIYEDEQERCDMDGAELVYEPTLEHVFPKHALKVIPEAVEWAGRARLVIPLSRSAQPETSIAHVNVVAGRSRFVFQIAAGIILTVAAFVAFYASQRLFHTKPQPANSRLETQNPKLETFDLSSTVSAASATSEKPETGNAKIEPSQSSNQLETPNLKRETAIPALPGLKPLPRLKPLPKLKPIPRLAEQSRSETVNRRPAVVTTKENTNAKKESRFGSFLKKTGRILTKPFKS